MEHEHVLTTLVENRPGVLTRISGLFSARGFNIDSLAVGETEDPTVSRMTIVVRGDDRILEQVTKQLNKLVDVIKVQDYGAEDFVQRELILIKVNTESKSRSELMQIADIFRARIVDVSTKNLTLELTGDQGKIAAMLDLLKPFGVREIARTGRIAMSRG